MANSPPLAKSQHCSIVLDLYIKVNDDSKSANVRLWNERNYAAINEELERIHVQRPNNRSLLWNVSECN